MLYASSSGLVIKLGYGGAPPWVYRNQAASAEARAYDYSRRVQELEAENQRLIAEVSRLKDENKRLKAELEQLKK